MFSHSKAIISTFLSDPIRFPAEESKQVQKLLSWFFCLFNIRYFYSLKFSDKLFSLSNCYWWLCIKRIQPIRYSVFIIEILVNVIKFEIVLNICKPNQEVIQKKKNIAIYSDYEKFVRLRILSNRCYIKFHIIWSVRHYFIYFSM